MREAHAVRTIAAMQAARVPRADEMTTPDLVQEFVERKQASARGETVTATQHARHLSVVSELRARGIIH